MASSVLLRSVELNVLDELQLAGAFHLGAGHGLMMHGLSPGQVVIVRASVSAAPRGSQFIVLKAVFAEFERWRAIRAGRNGIPECIAGRPAGVGAALISKCRAARATLELPRGVRTENPIGWRGRFPASPTPPARRCTMATTNPFTDFSKLLEQYKLPGVDMTSVIEARRKDIDAITEANKVAYEGMQALVQKQTEILSKTMQEIQAAAQKMTTGGNPAEAMAKQGEFVQQGLQTAFNNMRELAEMAQKSQAEALAVITKRAEQNIEEAKNLMKGKGK